MKILSVLLGCICLSPILICGQNELDAQFKKPIPELPATTLEAAGIHPDSISNLVQLLRQTPPPDFRGLVVIKEDKLVVEEYFNTYWRATIHDIRSAGKSITAMLMGIAIDQGLIQNVDQRVYSFFPTHQPPSPAHAAIRIRDLLTMSSGLDADTNDPNSPGNGGNWVAREDWASYILGLPMAFEPGSKWVYNDASPLLSGAIIQQVSGKNLAAFAQEHLFDPLGIRQVYWYSSPEGVTGAMGNLYLSTLDFAKLGLLVLNKGNWQGKSLISETWIQEMTQASLDISRQDPFADAYGYFWYLGRITVKGKSYAYTYASGNGGNKLFVLPELEVVVALTSSAYGQGYGHGRANNVWRKVLNAIR